jgi:hypothetical protein
MHSWPLEPAPRIAKSTPTKLEMKKLLANVITASSALVVYATAYAASAPPITVNVNYTPAPGGNSDPLLSSSSLAASALSGWRESGIPVILNAPEAEVGIQLNITALYSQPLDNLRVISGSMAVRIPRPGAADFGDAFSSCERGFFLWGARTSQEISVQRIKTGLTAEARNFARQCRSELKLN